MKRLSLLFVALICLLFATPYHCKAEIREKGPKVMDTLSYVMGMYIADQLKSDKVLSVIPFDGVEIAEGIGDGVVGKRDVVAVSINDYLSKFLSDTMASRLVEYEMRHAQDPNAVFQAFESKKECKEVSYAMGYMIGDASKSDIANASEIIYIDWMRMGIKDVYEGNLRVPVDDLNAFLGRVDTEPTAAPKATESIDTSKIDTLSYCIGADLGMNVKYQFGNININMKEVQKGMSDRFADKSKFADADALKMLELFFSETITKRQADYEQRLKSDSTLVFNPFVSEVESADIAYALGSNVGESLRKSRLPLYEYWVLAGFEDSVNGQTKLTNEQMSAFMQNFYTVTLPAENAKRSAEWIEAKSKEEGVVKTESGLLYKIIAAGDMSKAATKDADTVKATYVGRSQDGTEFDSGTHEFVLNTVISGWAEGAKLVGPGGKIILYLPAELAYGSAGAGGKIGPNEAIEFEIELLEVKPAEEEKPAEAPASTPAEAPAASPAQN